MDSQPKMETFTGNFVKREDYCRTCLTHTDLIHSVLENGLKQALTEVASVMIDKGDHFSTIICNHCEVKIREFYAFKLKCIEVQEYLKKYSSEISVQPVEPVVKEHVKIEDDFVDANRDIIELKPKVKKLRSKLTKKPDGKAQTKHGNRRRNTRSPVMCPICNKILHEKLERHLAIHDKYICRATSTCDKKCLNLSSLVKHVESEHRDVAKKFTCQYCPKTFYVDIQFRKHLKNEHVNGICDVCGVFVKQVRYHRRVVHGDQLLIFKCDLCERKFKFERTLKAHKAEHNEDLDPSIVCDHCGLKFVNIKAHILAKHKNIIEQPNEKTDCLGRSVRRTCRKCKGTFENLTAFFKHSRQVHGDTKKIFECKICGLKLTRSCNLRRHIAHVHEKKYDPYKCEICGHVGKSRTYLKKHMRTHTNERPYKCDLCPLALKSSGALIDHRRIHTGERPHVCNFCSKAFIQKSALNKHLTLHKRSG